MNSNVRMGSSPILGTNIKNIKFNNIMKSNIPVKEMPQSNKHEREITKRLALQMRGIYSPSYDWANYKINLGEHIINKRTHKEFLRKNHFGKFAKDK